MGNPVVIQRSQRVCSYSCDKTLLLSTQLRRGCGFREIFTDLHRNVAIICSFSNKAVRMAMLGVPLLILAVVTLVLMITAHVVPEWFVLDVNSPELSFVRRVDTGLWKICQMGTFLPERICLDYISDSGIENLSNTLRSAMAFGLLATILAGMGLILSIAMEMKGTLRTVLVVVLGPRILFAVSGLFMIVSASTFIGFVKQQEFDKVPFTKYGASFIIAWVTVATSLASALLAHLHHSKQQAPADGLAQQI
eukprot:scpid54755/ scgid3508/ 